MYKVSVLVPIYRVEKYIKRCAESLFMQTYGNIEYVFVDDCSPDDSIKILNATILEHPDRKDTVKIVTHEHNKGLAEARNTAIRASSGEFIMHVDSDDYVETNAVELLVEEQLKTGADIVSSNAIRHYHSSDVEMHFPTYTSKEDAVKDVSRASINHAIWGRLIRKDLYVRNHIEARVGCNQGEDWQVVPQLFYYSNLLSKIDAFIYHYNCTNENSYMSSSFKRTLCDQDLGSMKVVSDFLKSKGLYHRYDFEGVEIRHYYRYLYLSGMNSDKIYFGKMKNLILRYDKEHLRQIKWGGVKSLYEKIFIYWTIRAKIAKIKRIILHKWPKVIPKIVQRE